MPASLADLSNPERAAAAFCEAVNDGDLDGARGCFTRDAVLVTADGTGITGREAIGDILAQLIAGGTRISIEVSAVLSAGDVALAHQRWLFRLRGAIGPHDQSARPTLVLRCVESQWKLAVAAPWGWGG